MEVASSSPVLSVFESPLASSDGTPLGAALEAMVGKAMIVCMSRRICIDLYDAIVKLRPEWADADDEERARRQSDLLEQLQWPRRLAPLDGGAGQSHAPSGGGLMSAPVVKEEKLSPEAASLIAGMLHPEPSARIKAPQTVADSYFRDFELQDDEEIPEQKLDQPWRPLAGGRGAFFPRMKEKKPPKISRAARANICSASVTPPRKYVMGASRTPPENLFCVESVADAKFAFSKSAQFVASPSAPSHGMRPRTLQHAQGFGTLGLPLAKQPLAAA